MKPPLIRFCRPAGLLSDLVYSCQRAAVAAGAVLALTVTTARADDYVVVSAAAVPQYNRADDGKKAPRRETYVFSPGRHFTTPTGDKSSDKVSFEELVKTLAPALKEQNYFPAPDPTNADLLIIVHWGTTRTYEDPNRELNLEARNSALAEMRNSGDEDPDEGALNEILRNDDSAANLQQQYMSEAAEILGYKRSIREKQKRLFPSEHERTMVAELAEERYFVVLMAYDYTTFKTKKERKLVWATHMNVRSAGNNFVAAVPQMAKIGGKFFGRDEADVRHIQTRLRDPDIQIGDMRVVSSAEEEQTPKK